MTASASHIRFCPASDQSLLIYFDSDPSSPNNARWPHREVSSESSSSLNSVSLEIHERVRRLVRLIELQPIPCVRNLHPGYASVLVKFDPFHLRHEELQGILLDYIQRMESVPLPPPRDVQIPVCYGGEFGPDLNDVAELHGITPAQIIDLHSSTRYIVYFLGFVPGFAYLGDLPSQLVTPRLPLPRKSVPAGSVGIAKNHTGVYPISTPGGWRLLGRTPLKMFRPDRQEMSLLSIGDRVQFVPISPAKFASLERA